jgi:hypothetical protein
VDPKVLFLIALLAPVLLVAAGLFIHQENEATSTQPEETGL